MDPVDYETYIAKNKSILHNDPQREMLTFPYDDIIIPVCNTSSFCLDRYLNILFVFFVVVVVVLCPLKNNLLLWTQLRVLKG